MQGANSKNRISEVKSHIMSTVRVQSVARVLFRIVVAAKSLQLCPTLCDPIDGSPPGSPVPGILQAKTPKSVAISFSNAWKWKVKVKSLSRVWLLATPWTAAYQAHKLMGFSSFLQLLLGAPGSETLNMRVRRICCLTNLETMLLISLEAVTEWEQCPFPEAT